MEVLSLNKDLAADFFAFFDGPAFADNPYWKGCYCTFFHRAKDVTREEARLRPSRRHQAEEMITHGQMRGYLAYDGGRVVGWCNANARTAFARLGPPNPGDEGLAAVVCFVIDPVRRMQGIARALLAHAIADLARLGYRAMEAYPSSRAKSASGHYHGPLALYESFGFERMPGRKLVVHKTL